MSCLELRKAVLTDPSKLSAELLAHRDQCPSCAAFARGSSLFEQQLLEAVRVPVPPQLKQRVLLHQRAEAAAPGWSPDRRRFLAVAASVTAAAVGMLGYTVWRQRGLLAEDLLAHALEPHPPAGPGAAGSPAGLAARAQNLFAEIGIKNVSLPAGLANAWQCPMHHVIGPHIRIVRGDDWADFMFCPGLTRTGPKNFDGSGLAGVLHEHPRGVLAVVSPNAELVLELTSEAERLLTSLA